MAHKGKIGPVAFRRDLSLNWFDYGKKPFYNSFKVQFGPLPPGEAQPLQNKTLLTKGVAYPNLLDQFWEGHYQQYGLFFYKVELRCSFISGTSWIQEGGVFISGHGLIWHWHEVTSDAFLWPNFISTKTTDFWSKDWFQGQPTLRDDAISPLPWAEQPPPA